MFNVVPICVVSCKLPTHRKKIPKISEYCLRIYNTRGDSMSYQSQIKCPHLSRGLLTFTLKVK